MRRPLNAADAIRSAIKWKEDRDRALTKRAFEKELELRHFRSESGWSAHGVGSKPYPSLEPKPYPSLEPKPYPSLEPEPFPSLGPRLRPGIWHISCEGCDRVFRAELALPSSLQAVIPCPACKHDNC